MNSFFSRSNLKYMWILLGVLGVIVIILAVAYCFVTSDKTVKCDNNAAIKALQEKNIGDLKEAAGNFMIQKINDEYKLVFSDELNQDSMYEGEFARFNTLDDPNTVIKADYDKSKTLVEHVDKDINEVVCTIPVTFSGFSLTDKKATLSGRVLYTIHANGGNNVEVDAAPITEMFRSNFKPIYNKRNNQYLKFEYKTGKGEIIDAINQLPKEEFGDFFNPIDY